MTHFGKFIDKPKETVQEYLNRLLKQQKEYEASTD